MEWFSVNEKLPNDKREVLVGDGYKSYVVAWYSKRSNIWYASVDLLEIEGNGYILDLEKDDVNYWCEINPLKGNNL